MNTITPNYARSLRKALKKQFAEHRAMLAQIRMLREDTGHEGQNTLNRENAEGFLLDLLHRHKFHTQGMLYTLRTCKVEKFSNISPNAAKRMAAFHASR